MSKEDEFSRDELKPTHDGFDSPFVDEGLLVKEYEADFDSHLPLLEAESPFHNTSTHNPKPTSFQADEQDESNYAIHDKPGIDTDSSYSAEMDDLVPEDELVYMYEFDELELEVETYESFEVGTYQVTNDLGLTNSKEVSQFVELKLGVGFWEWASSDANLVVVRGAGSNYKPSDEHAYDDLFIVVMKDGTIFNYTRGNSEGTTSTKFVNDLKYNIYKDPKTNKYSTPALPEGRYRFSVGSHPMRGGYKALNVFSYNNLRTYPSELWNSKHGKNVVSGVNVHKGGNSWNWSTGCLTVHQSQYNDFISKFTSGNKGMLYIIGSAHSKYSSSSKPQSVVNVSSPTRAIIAFAQDVLNIIEKEELKVDGIYGPKTRDAIDRFQKKYSLGYGGAINEKTLLALAQRALEELAQQSLFEKGSLDERTLEAIFNFKTSKGLYGDSTLDAPTLSALLAALKGTSTNVVKSIQGNICGEAVDWAEVNVLFARGSQAVVTDIRTGKSFTVKRMGGRLHADVEPETAKDTQVLKDIYGGAFSWSRRPIVLTIGSRKIAGSMHGMPHGVQSIANNNYDGHHCLHFKGSKTHVKNEPCPNHQAAVNAATCK